MAHGNQIEFHRLARAIFTWRIHRNSRNVIAVTTGENGKFTLAALAT